MTMVARCGTRGLCHLPEGHAGLCVYARHAAPALDQLAAAREQLAQAIILLEQEILRRRAAEAALQAFVDGKFAVITPDESTH